MTRIFLTGGTGNSGRRLIAMALERGHTVTALVRDPAKLAEQFGGHPPEGLTILAGGLEDKPTLARQMAGHEVVIHAAGNANDGEAFPRLTAPVIRAAAEALGPGGRFWLFGGAAVLDVPGTRLKGVDLPKIPAIYQAHRTNLDAVRATGLDWSMLCPGPMVPAADGRPRDDLRLSVDGWPTPPSLMARLAPRIALSLAFARRVPEMTISYEDAVRVILDHLDRDGPFSRHRVGVALPKGMTAHKDYTPGVKG